MYCVFDINMIYIYRGQIMRIGLDIDDTICNTFELALPHICEHFNLDYKEYRKKE